MPEELFPIDSLRRARAQKVQTLQHLMVAALLISNAYPHLRGGEGGHLLLPALEMAGALAMMGAVVYERVQHSFGRHSSIGWVEIGAAALTFVEAVKRLYEPHTTALRILSFVIPAALLAIGLFDIRPRSLRALKFTGDELIHRSGPFRRHAVPMAGATSFRSTGSILELSYGDGTRRTLDLADAKNREAAISWAAVRLRERGLRQV